MKKPIFIICIILLFLSISSVNAGLFGPDTIECPQFSIEIPEDYHKGSEWYDNDEILFNDSLYLIGDENTGRNLMMYELDSFDSFNHTKTEEIIDSYEEDGIKIDKCYDSEDTSFIDGKTIHGKNYTYSEFEKDGHYYVIINEFKGDFNNFPADSDINLVKEIRNTLKIKN